MGERQRPQQRRIEHTEHRRRCAHTQSQRQHSRERETRCLAHLAQGVSQIVPQ